MKKTYYKNGLYVAFWEASSPKAILQIAHGMVEHIERYDHFARFLNYHGISVIGHDHRGHGHTAALRGDYGVFPNKPLALLDDLKMIFDEVKGIYPTLPHFLLGHSMGSFLVRIFLEKYSPDIDGLIVMGTGQIDPLLSKIGMHLSDVIKIMNGRTYRSSIFNRMTIDKYMKTFSPRRVRADWLSRDEKTVDNYMRDSFCQFMPSVGMYHEIFRFAYEACKVENIANVVQKDLPMLLISGDKDPVGKFSRGVLELNYLMKEAGYQNVRVRLYKNARHEILNELNKGDVYEDILHWMSNVLRKK